MNCNDCPSNDCDNYEECQPCCNCDYEHGCPCLTCCDYEEN